MVTASEPARLSDLLTALRPADGVERISVQDMLDQIGQRSFAPALLVPALLLVSPISAIPGMPTIGALITLTIALQALFGRNHLWLPGILRRRSLPAHRVVQALDWLAGPVGWVDRHTRDRLRFLTTPPLNRVALLAVVAIVLPWPILEPVPMLTSVGAFTVALFAAGILTRDGAFVVAGYLCVAGLATLILRVAGAVG